MLLPLRRRGKLLLLTCALLGAAAGASLGMGLLVGGGDADVAEQMAHDGERRRTL